jgi:hypothetical protein
MKVFTKGGTEEVGDCGIWVAGIDHYTLDADQMILDGIPTQVHNMPDTWYQRIVVYGNTAEQAEALRDKIMEVLNNE